MKIRIAALAVAATMLSATTLSAQDAGTVIARVGDVEITLGHAIVLREGLPQQFRTVPDATLLPAIIEQLIDQELLLQSRTDELSLRDRLTLENERRQYIANTTLIAAANAALGDEAIADAYAAFIEEFGQGEPVVEWNAAHILVRSRDEIDAVVAALEAGRDFAEVAREFSIDGSSAQGGGLGWFGPGMMIEPFEAAVAALEPGQISDPVETRFGWHVVQLIETRVAAAPTLEMIRGDLEQEIQRAAARALVEGLRARTAIENLSETLDPALLSRRDLLDD